MKISDKELDELFQSKLNKLETEPDAAVWNNILTELNSKPKKKSWMPGLRIAASLIVVFSVGLLLLHKKDGIIQKPLSQKVVKVEVKHGQPAIKPNKVLLEKKDMLLLTSKKRLIKEAHSFSNSKKVIVVQPTINLKPEMEYASTQISTQNKPETKLDSDLPKSNRMTTVPDATTSLKVQPEVETPAAIAVKPPVLAVKTSKPIVIAKRKSIRNMGDLVNLVMAKVDKRQDKLIEFTDSDDGDESIVTGINLGIISIKKEK